MSINFKEKKNEMQTSVYLVLYILLEVITGYVYYQYCSMYSMENNTFRATFVILMLTIPNLNLFFTYKEHRNLESIFSGIFLPVIVFEGIFTFNHVVITKFILIIGIMITILVTLIEIYTRKKSKSKTKGEKYFDYSLIRGIRVLIFLTFFIAFIYDRYLYKTDSTFLLRSYNYIDVNIPEASTLYEDTFEASIASIAKIDSSEWQNLSMEEKGNISSDPIEVDCYFLGMTDSLPSLEIVYTDDDYDVVYMYKEDKILISYNYLVSQKTDGYELLQKTLQAVYYRYQSQLIDLYDLIVSNQEQKQFLNLSLFNSIREYKNNCYYLSYCDEDDPEEISEFLEKNTMLLQEDASNYAKDRTEQYYALIQDYLENNKEGAKS